MFLMHRKEGANVYLYSQYTKISSLSTVISAAAHFKLKLFSLHSPQDISLQENYDKHCHNSI